MLHSAISTCISCMQRLPRWLSTCSGWNVNPHHHETKPKVLSPSKLLATQGYWSRRYGSALAEWSENRIPAHVPVMVQEITRLLNPQDGQVFLDMTFGAGGHTRSLLASGKKIKVFCLDRDPVAFKSAEKLADIKNQEGSVTPLHGKFSDVHLLLQQHGHGVDSLDGALFDVGASSMQFDDSSRGFSLSQDGPLDMRMDRENMKVTAEDVVNGLDEAGLYSIIKKYGEDKRAGVIARAIIDSRYAYGRISSTKRLAEIVHEAVEGSVHKDKLQRFSHPATKTFQALRIFINNELNELHNGLTIVNHLLKQDAVCAVISFHSLEDRIVKRQFHGIDMDTKMNMGVLQQSRSAKKLHKHAEVKDLLHSDWRPLFKGVKQPEIEEIEENARSRSAKLRAALKI